MTGRESRLPEIRRMQPEDIPAVARLERACFSEPWSEQGFLDALKLRDNIFLTARLDGRLIGYCGLYASADEGEITNVAVSEAARDRGIGGLLLEEAFRLAGRQGISSIYLEVRAGNASAIALYRRLGFEECGVRRNFYRLPTEDALVMTVRLG